MHYCPHSSVDTLVDIVHTVTIVAGNKLCREDNEVWMIINTVLITSNIPNKWSNLTNNLPINFFCVD